MLEARSKYDADQTIINQNYLINLNYDYPPGNQPLAFLTALPYYGATI